MKAIVANSAAIGCLEIGEIAAPVADSNEALVSVTTISLNRGELRRAEAAEPGMQIGWGLAGVVQSADREGSRPAEGGRAEGVRRCGGKGRGSGQGDPHAGGAEWGRADEDGITQHCAARAWGEA